MPAHLMVGNHDDTAAFGEAFPEIPRDENGFVQSGFDTPFGRFLLLDTKDPKTHAGAYCLARQAWLDRELDQTSKCVTNSSRAASEFNTRVHGFLAMGTKGNNSA